MHKINKKRSKLWVIVIFTFSSLLSFFYIYYLLTRDAIGPQIEVGLHWSAYQGVLELYKAEDHCASLGMRLPTKDELLNLYRSSPYWINEGCEAYKLYDSLIGDEMHCNYWSNTLSGTWTYGVRMKTHTLLRPFEKDLVGSYVYFSKLDVRCVKYYYRG